MNIYLLLRSNQLFLVLNNNFDSILTFDSQNTIIKNGRVHDFQAFEKELKAILKSKIKRKWYLRTPYNALISIPKSYSPSDKYILLTSLNRVGISQMAWTYNDIVYIEGMKDSNLEPQHPIIVDVDDYEIRVSKLFNRDHLQFDCLPIGSKTIQEFQVTDQDNTFIQNSIKDKVQEAANPDSNIHYIGNRLKFIPNIFDDTEKIEYDHAFIQKSMLGLKSLYLLSKKR